MKCPECDIKIKKTTNCLLSCSGCLTLLKRHRLSTSRFSRWSVHCPINEPNRDKSDPVVLYMDEPSHHYSVKRPIRFNLPPREYEGQRSYSTYRIGQSRGARSTPKVDPIDPLEH